MNGKLFVLLRADPGESTEGERVVCLDASTGETLWENRFNVYLSDVPDTRVGWSSCVGDPETGNIYALGVCGLFLCIDGDSGKTLWSRPLHEQFGLLSTYGGRTNFPVIFDDLVIISGIVIGWGDMAKPCHRFIGLDKRTGSVVWFDGTRELPYDTTYSSPAITNLDGQMALVIGSGDGAVWAMQPRTGVPIWQYRFFSPRSECDSACRQRPGVFPAIPRRTLLARQWDPWVAIDGTGKGDITDTGELWKRDELMAGKSSPVAVGNNLYIVDDRAKLWVFDMESGDQVARIPLGTMMRSSPLVADGKIYTITAGGRWHILKIDKENGARRFKSGELVRGEESHASPICANGRVYIQTTGRLYCLANPDVNPDVNPAVNPDADTDPDGSPKASGGDSAQGSVLPGETPVGDDSRPTHLQIVSRRDDRQTR